MKKTYIMPAMLVTNIQLQQMIASSPSSPASTLHDEEANPTNEVLSRGGGNSLWDDED